MGYICTIKRMNTGRFVMTKECICCKVVKDESKFYTDKRTFDGLDRKCMVCHNARITIPMEGRSNNGAEYQANYYRKRKQKLRGFRNVVKEVYAEMGEVFSDKNDILQQIESWRNKLKSIAEDDGRA